MSDDSFSAKLRNLSHDYYQNHISFNEYRVTRKTLLEQIDEEFNGETMITGVTQPQESKKTSLFMKTIAFMANTDLTHKKKSD